ncbi:hypothetical protein ABZ714_01760 [Streptomyces sp. NPDC006798]|uniref:hypothetical protein n=1 Tax=Streptomyces sp. NPDC006798 TaxID=3155462 RepID=UPI0033F7D15F
MTGSRDRWFPPADGPVGEPTGRVESGHEPGHDGSDAEAELRVLLARTVPNLPTPLNRMAQVRDRVRRHRRRRRAVVAAATTAALAAAVLVLDGTGLPGPGLWNGAGDGTGDVAATPAPLSTQAPPVSTARRVTNPDLGGLALEFPDGWYTMTLPDAPESLDSRGTYATNRPLSTVDQPCEPGPCLPIRWMPADGLIVEVYGELQQPVREADKAEGVPLTVRAGVSSACRTAGGAKEYAGEIGGAPGMYLRVYVTVCAATEAPAERLAEVSEVMKAATFPASGSGAVPRPGEVS